MLAPFPVNLRTRAISQPAAEQAPNSSQDLDSKPRVDPPAASQSTFTLADGTEPEYPLRRNQSQSRLSSSKALPRHFPFTRRRTSSLTCHNLPTPDAAHDTTPIPPRPPRNPMRSMHADILPKRPSTSSGTPDGSQFISPIAVTALGYAASPFPVSPFSGMRPLRRRSTKKSVRKGKEPLAASSPAEQSANSSPKSGSSSSSCIEESKKNVNFSTADRAILEELQRGITARELQFIMKGGKKHHCYSPAIAPYPRNYERVVVDHDVWETAACKQICGSVTFHVFDTPPTKVLDIGCGSGSWILDCARQWRQCEFVGIDLVPLHPDLSHFTSDLGARITWMQVNCLEGLPFPDEEFDYVHIKRIALGIPEDKWDHFLEEITRIMKPGGAFEMIEEDLYFPGKQAMTPVSRTPSPLPYLPTPPHSNDDHSTKQSLPRISTAVKYTDSSVTPSSSTTPSSPMTMIPATSSHGLASPVSLSPSITLPGPGLASVPQGVEASPPQSSTPLLLHAVPKPPQNPRDHSLLEYIYTEMHSSRFINLAPLSLLSNSLPLHFKDVRTHAPMTFMFPPQCAIHAKRRLVNAFDEPESDSDLSDSDNDMESTHAQAPTPRPSRIANGHGGHSRSHSRQRLSKDLRRTSESTFISGNQILRQTQSYIVLDETRLPAVSPAHHKASLASSTGSAPQSPVQMKKAFQFPPVSNEPPENGSYHSPLSPGDAYAAAALANHLPNKKLNIDLKSLRMHLSARVTEVLACAETMWEWVAEFQQREKAKAREMAQDSDKDKTITERDWERAERRTSSLMEAEAQRQDVLALVRSDFDALLTRFELDMHDSIALDTSIANTFHCPFPSIVRTPERKAFDTACAKWDEYQAQQRQAGVQGRTRSHSAATSASANHGRARAGSRTSANSASTRGAVPGVETQHEEKGSSPSPDPIQRLSRTIRVFCAWKA